VLQSAGGFALSAPFLAPSCPFMGRHEQPIRLRETSVVFAPDTPVIDATFTEVGAERRTVWGRVKAGLQAVLWALAIGFFIPPAWILVQRFAEMFRPF
jgi:hypothetical protein